MANYDKRARRISLIEGCIGTLKSIPWDKVSDDDLETLEAYCIHSEQKEVKR